MTDGVGRVVAGCFSLAAFAVAVLAGMASGNPAASVIGRALIAMIVCYPMGWAIGLLCQRVINEHAAARDQAETGLSTTVGPAPVLEADEPVLEV